jgi:hypothetical protein
MIPTMAVAIARVDGGRVDLRAGSSSAIDLEPEPRFVDGRALHNGGRARLLVAVSRRR